MKKPNSFLLDEKTEVEVVMRKKMQLADYKKMIPQSIKNGWEIKAYQIGFFSIGIKKEVKP